MSIILHVDMDCFFASVEIREDIGLIGKPVIVGADPQNGNGRGVVTTCSYEARALGIHSAMPISKAYSLAPEAFYVRPKYGNYIRASRNIMKILRSYGEGFQQRSIDEAYIDITKCAETFEQAERLGRKIKKEVLKKEGITCSVGIGPNKLISKIASDIDKPDGLKIVKQEEIKTFLFPLDIRKIPGIGPKTEKALIKLGIRTVEELAKRDTITLIRYFGKWGRRMHYLANGVDNSEVGGRRSSPKSIGKERTFREDTDDQKKIDETIKKLSEKVQRRALDVGLFFKTITIKVRLADFSTFTRSKTIEFPTTNLMMIKETASNLLREFMKKGKKIRLIGVRVSGLIKIETRQTTLEEYNGRYFYYYQEKKVDHIS